MIEIAVLVQEAVLVDVAGRVRVVRSELAIFVPTTKLLTGGGVTHFWPEVVGHFLTDTLVATLGLGIGRGEYEQQEYEEHDWCSWDD